MSLAQVARKCPGGIICLLSALRVHNLTTKAPHEVWLAISSKARPRNSTTPLFESLDSQDQHSLKVSTNMMSTGVKVRVTNIPKTVADCFKYRNKIGLDVSLEALQEAHRSKRMSLDELWYFAKICRVTRVMRPCIESLTA
jgi:predicted transcriptional regulator of viral defense system